MSAPPARERLVGGYGRDGGGDASGISRLRSRPDGTLALDSLAVETPSPSLLLVEGDTVIAVAEGRGTVDAFVQGADGRLRPLWSAPSGGVAPCAVARWGPLLVAANYGDGALGILDGGALVQVLAGEGSGPHPAQTAPHAHAVVALDEETLLSLDLGADLVHLHARSGSRVRRTASAALPAGTGPRDVVRHPAGPLLVLGELSAELLVLDEGSLALRAAVALPGAEPGDHAAALALSASGRFVYTALRGSDRIAVLEFSTEERTLRPVGWAPSGGAGPRHLVVDGELLHVANQLSGSVASFRLDADGRPTLLGRPTAVPSPSYLAPVTR